MPSAIRQNVDAGQAVYSPFVLAIYDVLVLGLSNQFLWRCPTATLRALYDRSVRPRHLDIGVGTGYFLDHARWPVAEPDITLLDLNANSLEAAGRRICRYRPKAVTADALKPLPVAGDFQSVGLCYLLHCLPGAMPEKARLLFGHVAEVTAPGGSVFGATIVRGGAPRSFAAQALMDLYCSRGIFSNEDDHAADLESALKARFSDVRVEMHGAVAVFEAKRA
ncbi:MAG: class I SAM-dependent methyltransferase [Hyphomicrobium sp.]|jgi:SAM-dependent methyltransferase